MSDKLNFRFTIPDLPEGEALTASEIEERLLENLDEDPESTDTLWSLAVLYSQFRHFEQSAACLRRVIELADDPEIHGSCCLALGQLEEQQGDYVAAAKCYREAFAMEPCSNQTWFFIHNNLGYNQTGDHRSALRYLEQAIVIDPTRPNGFKNLGLAHQGLGELQQAAENFILATQADAADPRSLDHLDTLLEANPMLEVDVPDLRDRVEACRKAVEYARSQQPDFEKKWGEMRDAQKSD